VHIKRKSDYSMIMLEQLTIVCISQYYHTWKNNEKIEVFAPAWWRLWQNDERCHI